MISRILDERKIKKLARLIDGARRIVITTHLSPDGDAMGSSLAFARVLSNMGKDVAVIVPDQPLQQLMFLPGAKDVIVGSRYPDFASSLFARADLIICLDFNELRRIDRLAPYVEASKADKVMIDHHLHPGDFADTGNFAYNANDPDAYIIEAELVRKGVDKVELYNRLLNTVSENCLRLTSYALLERMEVFADMHAALICLTRDELNRFHYVKGDTEGLVNRPLAIPGIVYSAFLREEDGYVKVSMRSLGDFPVNRLCNDHFGGGGHLNAAGGEFPGTLDECAALFRSMLSENKEKYIDKNKEE